MSMTTGLAPFCHCDEISHWPQSCAVPRRLTRHPKASLFPLPSLLSHSKHSFMPSFLLQLPSQTLSCLSPSESWCYQYLTHSESGSISRPDIRPLFIFHCPSVLRPINQRAIARMDAMMLTQPLPQQGPWNGTDKINERNSIWQE